MITYDAVFNPSKNDGVFAISLVEDPAMKGFFLALKEQEVIQLKEIDKEQRILMGLVLEPNKPIYRNQNGEEFNIVFKEDVIKELSHNFFKGGFQKNSKLEHESPIEGVTFVESWLVENPKIDKSANFGFSYPKGSWIATMKVENDDIWNNYIKTGKLKGFSVDAMIDLKEINLKTEKMESNLVNDFIKDVKTALGINKPEVKVTLGSIKSGETDIMFDGEMLMVGGAVWLETEEGMKEPLPVGEYPLESGEVLSVTEPGVVGAIGNAPMEEAPAELEKAPAQPAAPGGDVLNQIKSLLIKYSSESDAKFNALEIRFNEMEKKNTELKKEIVELSSEPAAKKIVASPVQLNSTGRILNKLRNN
jgi:hypothetical protein